ncbi:MAG: hypothetical protein VR72_08405 [Clostridiaceae bacterium BRH_c20a]|nr:MAG: hypothetical protein VR72_08405 [Clostridiaceae bacterium BRH_c20a]
MTLRIVGISASPRKANTEILIKEALEGAKITQDVETVFISLAGKKINGCINCRGCITQGKCIIKDDWEETFKPLIDPIPNGVILGAPVYFFNLNSQARAYMERATSLLKGLFFKDAKQFPPDWSKTAAAGVSVGYDRHGGQEHTISSIIHWFLINNFVAVGGSHIGYIGAPGWLMDEANKDSVAKDIKVGMASARIVGRKVAETGLMLKYGADILEQMKVNGEI